MKKLILVAAALTVAIIGFGGLKASTTYAHPAKLWLINEVVATEQESAALGTAVTDCDSTTAGNQAPPCNLADPLQLATFLASGATLDDAATASAGQVGTAGFTGPVFLVAQTDGSATDMTLNPKGLAVADTVAGDGLVHCAGLVGGADVDCAGGASGDDGYVVYTFVGGGSNSVGSTVSVDVLQDLVSVSQDVTVVGIPHDFQAVAVLDKTTIQEGSSSCALTDSISNPTRAGVIATVADVDGTNLVGVPFIITFSSSSASTAKVSSIGGTGTTLLLPDGKTIAQYNVVCGVAPGDATLSVKIPAAYIGAGSGNVTRTIDYKVTGVPASIALTASPAAIACDGSATSSVTAKVTDSAGNNVVDNTSVNFGVVALGTANPINTKTTAGEASSTITPLSGATAGVTVIVTSGDAQASIRVDCSLPVPTVAPAASPTPIGGTGTITGPNTGTGGYLGQDSSAGFPMWTLVALVLGSLVLVGGGMVTRRTGK